MKTKTLQSIAVALGMGLCTLVQAQSTYTSPGNWDNYRGVSSQPTTLVAATAAEDVPAPPAKSESAYSKAMSEPCCGDVRLPLAPYFGSSNLLFLTLEEGSGFPIAWGLGDYSSATVDPDATTGFDITAGRYINCGRNAVGVTYMLWNPDRQTELRTGLAGTIGAWRPSYNDLSVDVGLGADTVYGIIDGTALAYAGAEGVRTTRDLRFQGIEANLFTFGLMGARRVSYAGCNSGSNWCSKIGLNRGCNGFGGAAGPLARACNGRVRIMTSHGFRWMEVQDSLELAYNVDTFAGYQINDIYHNVDVENNLFGYQFGGRLTYCLTRNLNLNIGGKFGIYGNDVELRHRLGTRGALAYRNGFPGDEISTESSDTVLATLGELDLGLGWRIGRAWSVRGGYRLYGLSGVASAIDSVPTAYSTVADSGKVYANDSYVLHGGYVGLEYNW